MVTLTSPATIRLAPYDRNPSVASANFLSTAVGPHGSTVRATYTVPTARKAQVTCATVVVIRRTAATTPGTTFGVVNVGAAQFAIAWFTDNALNVQYTDKHETSGVIAATNTAVITTQDSSAAGTIDFAILFSIAEFDA